MKKNRRIFWILLIILLSHIAGPIVLAENKEGINKQDKDDSPLLHVDDLKDPASLAIKLWKSQEALSQYFRKLFSPDIQRLLNEYDGSKPLSEAFQKALVDELNRLIQGECLYDEQSFAQVKLTEVTRRLVEENPVGEDLIELNRLLLEEAYPDEIAESQRDFFIGYAENLDQDGKGVTILKGNVRIYRYDGYMYTDKVTLYRDEDTKELIKTVAEGNVVLKDKDILAHCDYTVFDEIENTVELTGSVVVTQSEDRIEATYLKYNRKTGQRTAKGSPDKLIKFRIKIKTKEKEPTKEE